MVEQKTTQKLCWIPGLLISRLDFRTGVWAGMVLSLGISLGCGSKSKRPEPSGGNIVSPQNGTSTSTSHSSGGSQSNSGENDTKLGASSPTVQRDSELTSAMKSGDQTRIYRESVRVLMADPVNVDALVANGIYFYRNQQPIAAQLQFQKALGVRETPDLLNNVGVTFLAQNKEAEAIEKFRKAIQLQSNHAPSLANLGAIYVSHKNFGKALAVLKPAYEEGLREAALLNNYAVSLVANGQMEIAKGIYKEALNKAPNNPSVLLNYSVLLIDFSVDPKEGLNVLNRLRVIGPDPKAGLRVNTLEQKARSGLK